MKHYPIFDGIDPQPRPLPRTSQPHQERLPGFLETPAVLDVEAARADYARAVRAQTQAAFAAVYGEAGRQAPKGGPR